MFEWRDDDSGETPVQTAQSGGWFVLFEGEQMDEAQASGRWVKGRGVEVEQ